MQFELTIGEYEKIKEISLLLKRFNIRNVSITQKFKHMNNTVVAERLLKENPGLDVTLVFSVKLNYSEDYNKIQESFWKFKTDANKLGIKKFLIVSGANRKLYSSIDLLNFLKFKDLGANQVFCVYNPFLTNYLGDDEEERLRYKLASKTISGVYLQLGDDLIKLREGIKKVKHIAKGKKLYGSLLVPNTYILNNLKYKPWYGVKFSGSYLNDLDFANRKTKEVLKIYKANNIEPLLQVIPFSNDNLYASRRIFDSRF